ncbi:hypothetical protein RND71_029804 [Anisodus tanguticus]|uniref:Uncharacterized protein n=1 Tax=Anisodus tanguticus TaxID=243964 RepID=A0AAE1RER7_9SOLA|nr:hypothetical protein RND71_029804 [Anisodus tanguticus]
MLSSKPFNPTGILAAATYTIFSMLSLTLWIPIYDHKVVPLLRRITGKGGITILQRMGFGIFLTVLSSLVSAFIEQRRRKLVFTNPALGIYSERGLISSMSALWLVPQLSLAGLAEAFCAIGQVEFNYKQFPENMKSIAGACARWYKGSDDTSSVTLKMGRKNVEKHFV